MWSSTMRLPILLLTGLSLCAQSALCAQPAPKKKAAPKARPAPPAAVEAKPETPAIFPVLSVEATGSKLYPSDEITAASGLKLGEPGSEALFNQARDRLVSMGVFASVAYQYEAAPGGKPGYKVTFEVADVDITYPVRFSGLGVEEAELSAHLKRTVPLYRGRLAPTPVMLARIRKAIEEFLAAQGRPAAVASRITSDNPAELYVLFHPEGAPPVIAEVRFSGNQILPSSLLQNTIHGVAIGVEYREAFFRELLQNSIVPLYEARGRLRVKFPSIEAKPAEKAKGLALLVKIEEGDSYKLRRVKVEGTQTLDDELLKTANLTEEDVANFDEVKNAQQRIRQRLMTGGYLRASSKVAREIDDVKKTVDVTFLVEPGPRYNFGKLEIKGLDIIGEAAIKKAWALEPGKVFNADYPPFFLNRVREENMFDDLGETSHIITPDDRNLTVDVTLIFKGKGPQPKKRRF